VTASRQILVDDRANEIYRGGGRSRPGIVAHDV